MSEYRVKVSFQYPAHDDHGIEYVVAAKTKAEANKKARKQAEDDGHSGPWVKDKGRITFTAEAI